MQHYQPCNEEDATTGSEQIAQEIKVLEDKLSEAIADKEELAQRCHELDMQVRKTVANISKKKKASTAVCSGRWCKLCT